MTSVKRFEKCTQSDSAYIQLVKLYLPLCLMNIITGEERVVICHRFPLNNSTFKTQISVKKLTLLNPLNVILSFNLLREGNLFIHHRMSRRLTTTILNREDLCRCLYLHIHALFIILKSHISNQLLLLWEKL